MTLVLRKQPILFVSMGSILLGLTGFLENGVFKQVSEKKTCIAFPLNSVLKSPDNRKLSYLPTYKSNFCKCSGAKKLMYYYSKFQLGELLFQLPDKVTMSQRCRK